MPTLVRIAQTKDAGRKLKYFARGDMGMSSGQFSSVKARGALLVNGERATANFLLSAGDVVEAVLPEDAPAAIPPDERPVSIVYADEDLLILDKPAPLATQFSPRQPERMALENRLAAHFGKNFVFRPLNRLDRGTSGLLAAARHAHACQMLQRDLHTERFRREYLAVVEGRLEGEGTIDLPIAKESGATVRRIVDFQNGKPSVTHYRAEKISPGYTLVRLRLETGRTHQIRVHMARLGHPVAGDFLYGREDPRLPGRFALHSAFLALVHPVSGERLQWSSPLPQEFLPFLSS